ncbi:MAG TPA: SUMF1/EgtB/PvdO family nonheme iron enzyme [Chitinophaga sp.]
MTITLLIYLLSFSSPVQDTSFVRIPAGDYWVGQKDHQVNPLRKVHVNSYYIATTEVTNRQFAAFIQATGYRTDAERLHNAMVFEPGLKEFRWLEDSTAYWRYPNGVSRGGITDKMDHPVTTISYADVQAYCKWAKVRLPSFDEWEIASRAGARTRYFWGDDVAAIGQYANVWHGHDHLVADSSDGYMYTSPVGSFQPNGFGLYDVYGNVFEFCEGHLGKEQAVHARGGSWWCSQHACSYFNSVEIGRVHPHASFSNQGFRVVKL